MSVARPDSAILTDLLGLAKTIVERPTPDFAAADRLAALRAEMDRSIARPHETRRFVDNVAIVLWCALDEIVHTPIGTARTALLRVIARCAAELVADDAHEALKLEHMHR